MPAFGQPPSSASADAPPHPWIATAPPSFARLIDKGQVRIVVDDKWLREAGKQAATLFRIRVDYRFRYQVSGSREVEDDPSHVEDQILARIQITQLDLDHTVTVGTRFTPEKPWETKMMRHEFDHVSISTDPRFIKIARKVMELPIRCSVIREASKSLAQEDVASELKAQTSARVEALERLVQANYDALDRESIDGQSELDGRLQFFQGLYSKASLRRCEFSYLDALGRNADDSSAKEVSEHYLFVEAP